MLIYFLCSVVSGIVSGLIVLIGYQFLEKTPKPPPSHFPAGHGPALVRQSSKRKPKINNEHAAYLKELDEEKKGYFSG